MKKKKRKKKAKEESEGVFENISVERCAFSLDSLEMTDKNEAHDICLSVSCLSQSSVSLF